MHYDVIIVGSGPAGIFAALELLSGDKGLKVLIIEKGMDIDERVCPLKVREVSCRACHECALLSGWGGAGAFSDGKLNLSPEIGGFLSRYVTEDDLKSLIGYVDDVYRRYGAPDMVYGEDISELKKLERLSSMNDLVLIPSRIRHIGTDRCKDLLKRLREVINAKVDIAFRKDVKRVIIKDARVLGVRTSDGQEYYGDFVILAPGREGSRWLEAEAKAMGLSLILVVRDSGCARNLGFR